MPSATTNPAPGSSSPVTRLAPSPTGALHPGNARTFLVNWAMARQARWRIVMRMEDLDGPRIKAQAAEQALDVLRWLGIDWDGDTLYQAHDLTPYRDALERLLAKRLIYPCSLTRSEIAQAQSAPHAPGSDPRQPSHETRYPGTSRPAPDTPEDQWPAPADLLSDGPACWRVIVPDQPITFEDRLIGPQTLHVQRDVGDFVVASKAGRPAYQLAVVVDDARQGVTEVVRGDDLVSSTGRQLWLYQMLGLTPVPRYTHLPLVLGEDGKRLAKRHGDTRLSLYRDQGVPPERVVGLVAYWSGITDTLVPMPADEFADRFDLARLPRTPITFTQEQHAWLLNKD